MNHPDQNADNLLAAEYMTVDFEADELADMPDHLVGLPGGAWALWRWVGLRGAGFPAEHVRALADQACADAADQALRAEAAAQQAQDHAQAVLNAALDQLRQAQAWEDSARRDPLVRALRQIKQGKAPGALGDDGIDDATAALHHARAAVTTAWADFRRAFDAATTRLSLAIQELAQLEGFQEAIIWQNRRAFHSGIVPLLQRSPESAPRGSKRRQHEELVASYAQRYCVKNDTIGFFGPVGWAQIAPWPEAIDVRPGPGLIAARTVFFEGWCIDEFAETLSRSQAILPWVAPRRMPFVRVEGTTLYTPYSAPIRLVPQQVAVLHACDGARAAKDLAAELVRDRSSRLTSENEVYAVLRELSARGLIAWTLEVPLGSNPEQTLRRLIERIGDEPLRRNALAGLTELEAGRAAVIAARGDAARLDRALADLEATFTRLTDAAATRSAGKMYAGRTLVYEDCRRNLAMTIGPDVIEELGPPLTLLLASARWLTFQVGQTYSEALKQIYVELARAAESPVVDFGALWSQAQTILYQDHNTLADKLVPKLQALWAEILALPAGQRRVAYHSEELRARVAATFDAPSRGWMSACYHSPDIMIVASSVEAIQRGEYQFVMGELHVAMNTLGAAFFLGQHPFPEELFMAVEHDMPEQRLVPIISRHWERVTTRSRPALVSSRDFRLALFPDSGGVPKGRELPISALVVEERDGAMIVRTRDGRQRFDLIETFALILSSKAVNCFQMLPRDRHTPRVTIDRLVVCREAWSFPPQEIGFAVEKNAADRFVAARRWAGEHGMPRRVFVKSPVEVKPLYVDFDSPLYVDIFAKVVRRTIESGRPDMLIAVTEMLPDLDQVWLPDSEGRRYTSEFRFVAVDLAP